MKDTKLEMSTERDAQTGKEEPNRPELGDKSEVEITNTIKEEKIKNIKGDDHSIEEYKKKNGFLDYKNASEKDSNYKGKKVNKKPGIKNSNIKRNRIDYKKNTFLIIAIIFFNLIIPNNNMIEYKDSIIMMKVQGPGFSNILYSGYLSGHQPNSIYINGDPKSTITNRYYFDEINNSVKLLWTNPINNCYQMFYHCSNITEIDLSNFATSNVQVMWSMFEGCSQLSSLNLLNFDTSQVTDMESMFEGCSQLSSLDLSYFRTSNVKWMNHMFEGFSQLTSLDLSHFNTLNVNYMDNMFNGCSNLEYININTNFREGNSPTISNIFITFQKI